MARRSQVHRRPVEEATPQRRVAQADTSAHTNGDFTTLWENVSQQILAVTFWFDPDPQQESSPVTVRFSGHRVDMKGQVESDDRFVHDETIDKVIAGSGPISLTARIHDVNPGEWIVTAHILKTTSSTRRSRGQGKPTITPDTLRLPTRLWHRWAHTAGSSEPVRTCLLPFARVPGILLGIWATMVTLGIAIALALQALVISRDHLAFNSVWAISLVAIVVGIVGAKVWFIISYRLEHLITGWCIQGFIVGATLAAAIMLVVLSVPAGSFLDVTAPGLLVAMAVGRVGCFFAGCCGGPPTAARWGIWSSDQRVGARRIPTQLLESALALSLGLVLLVMVLSHGPAGGAFFVAGLAAYTLIRQGILHLRAEERKTRLGGPITAALSALILLAAIVFLAR